MAENSSGVEEEAPAPQVAILAQYVKDLSFENPNAPKSLQQLAQVQPKIEVNVNVSARRADQNNEVYEIDLKITAGARQNDETAFVVDLLYSGIFGLRNIPEDMLEPFLLVEAPRLIFPFARRIIGDTTRDGGFPPLMLDPIDFAALYLQQREAGAPPAILN
jgi:preprotein translocase subunit SecB